MIHYQPRSSEGSALHVMGEDKCLSQEKPVDIGPLRSPASLEGHTGKQDMNNTGESCATISRINIDILPAERRDSANAGVVQESQPQHVDAADEVDSQCSISQEKERLQGNTKSSDQPGNLLPRRSSDGGDGEGSELVKPLYPSNKDQKPDQFQELPPRLLPSYPGIGKVDIIATQQNDGNQGGPVAGCVNSSRTSSTASAKDRPLSARERRRLKQSQEEMLPSGPAVQRTPSAVEPLKPQEEDQPIPAQRFSSDCSITQMNHTLPREKEKRLMHGLSEDELSSSTSSTDKSDGDSREGKSHTNEMKDLVQLMTQTLRLEAKESCEDLQVLNPGSEFRLHRKYRDTLVLHGKVAEEVEPHCTELPTGIIPGSEKIRRIVEVLRADVIQGLGIQLLEQVFDLLGEEDELEREARLQEHMGDKYTTYCVKARQLKFFEENVSF